MWKVVIADDEPLIVSGLSEKVNWKQMDCTVVGVASNGLQARTHLEKLNPDILLTDVAMPGMTGLELAAWLRQQKRHTRVILLSAYDYFQYAQEGIRMGACDYILKPINMERLREAVSKAIDQLETDGAQRPENSRTQKWESKELDLLFDAVQYGAVARERLAGFERGFVLCVKAFNQKKSDDTALLNARHAIADYLQTRCTPCYCRSNEQMLIFTVPAQTQGEAEIMIERIGQIASETCKDHATLCVATAGAEICTLEGLHEQYLDCAAQMEQAYFSSNGGIWRRRAPQKPVLVQCELDELRSALRNGNRERMRAAFDSMCEKLLCGQDAEHAAHSMREAHRIATNVASMMGMIEKPLLSSERKNETFAEKRRQVTQYLESICAFIAQNQDTAGRLRLMMQENCMRAEFSLSEAAEKMGMSVPYMSRLFKKELGENFQEMLVRLRIEKACELLRETSLRNNEISGRVGFEDERYFGQVFRRHCGITPGQYRTLKKKSQQ